MRNYTLILLIFGVLNAHCQNQPQENLAKSKKGNQKTEEMEYNKLTPEEEHIIIYKGTERPFSGKYNDFYEKGVYNCKRCDTPLFKSETKFDGHCGWPSFDQALAGAVKEVPDADGMRTEIVCANCGAHLGHVFVGEGFTPRNTRHCVNSVSLSFKPLQIADADKDASEIAIFAGGCFWGTEYWMQMQKGVISTEVGYIGGKEQNPTYEQVCAHLTGHAEAVKIVFNPKMVSYETLLKLFFEIHDPTQVNRQGPDVGEQYRSEIFYADEAQKQTAKKLINILKSKGLNVVTKLSKVGDFWSAEDYHQDYYKNKGSKPYCHFYTKRF